MPKRLRGWKADQEKAHHRATHALSKTLPLHLNLYNINNNI